MLTVSLTNLTISTYRLFDIGGCHADIGRNEKYVDLKSVGTGLFDLACIFDPALGRYSVKTCDDRDIDTFFRFPDDIKVSCCADCIVMQIGEKIRRLGRRVVLSTGKPVRSFSVSLRICSSKSENITTAPAPASSIATMFSSFCDKGIGRNDQRRSVESNPIYFVLKSGISISSSFC